MSSSAKKIYFTAGPAKIPHEVMLQVERELLNYNGMDIGVMEMSHRSKEFGAIRDEAEANLRKVMCIPDNYSVLFMHGGAKTQFDAVPLNLCLKYDEGRVDYLVTGTWSKLAVKEVLKYTQEQHIRKQEVSFTRQPTRDDLLEYDEINYRYYCDNETIQGVEFNYVPEYGYAKKVPIVCDMTSNFLSRPVDVSKFGVIFAGAQKNCGIAGLAIVIVRKDLIGKEMRMTPSMMSYKVMDDNKSLANTPLTFAIYVANLCFKWILERGGLEAMDRFSQEKSQVLYNLIDESGGFYTNPVEKVSRSRMNVVFLLSNTDLEAKFLEESKIANIYEIKGHRSVGGFRASLYNGVTMEDVKRLASFMTEFKRKHSS